mgnify:CR=1 FL=1
MKVTRIVLTAAVALIAASSIAGARECSRPSRPAIPDGKTASDDAMKAAQGKVATYIKDVNAYTHCMADEIKASQEEAKEVSENWNAQSKIFTSTPKQQ